MTTQAGWTDSDGNWHSFLKGFRKAPPCEHTSLTYGPSPTGASGIWCDDCGATLASVYAEPDYGEHDALSCGRSPHWIPRRAAWLSGLNGLSFGLDHTDPRLAGVYRAYRAGLRRRAWIQSGQAAVSQASRWLDRFDHDEPAQHRGHAFGDL